jgi:CheY-like chemotaxis protein
MQQGNRMSLQESGAIVHPTPAWSRQSARRVWVDRDEVKRRLHAASVLVISQDVENAGRIFVGLGRLACAVRLARLSIQAMKMLEQVRPAICVVDADDGDKEAPALLRDLRAHPVTQDALFVALIARESPGRRRRLTQAGYHGVLTKPLDEHLFPQELLRGIPVLAAGTWQPAQGR